MKWFNNLQMAQKLVLSFIIMIVFIGVVGYIGISSMQRINRNLKDIYETDLASVKSIGELKENLTQIRASMLLILYERDRNKLKSIEDEINSLKIANDKLMEEYQHTTRRIWPKG